MFPLILACKFSSAKPEEPFKMGDIIKVEGKEGQVIGINLRYVTIESNNETILIPNSISVSKIVSVSK